MSSGTTMAAPTASSSYSDTHSLRFPNTTGDFDDEWGINSNGSSYEMAEFDIPFGPYAKTERLGRIADWSNPANNESHYSSGNRRATSSRIQPSGKVDLEETGWSFVTEAGTARTSTTKKAPKGPVPTSLNGIRTGDSRNFRSGPANSKGSGQSRRGGWGPRFSEHHSQRKREPSVIVQGDWRIQEEIEFNRLAKLQLDSDDSKILKITGRPFVLDRSIDKINTRNERLISLSDKVNRSSNNLSSKFLEDDETAIALAKGVNAVAVMSDVVASLLMACQRTVIPWDIIIRKRNGILFFDKRADSPIDQILVNETSLDAPVDDRTSDLINGAHSLSKEATLIQQNLPSTLSKETEIIGQEADHIKDGFGLIYSSLQLGEGIPVLIRSQFGALNSTNKKPIHISTLLEYEHKGAAGMDWRLKLDGQMGAVFAYEIRNNGAMLSRTVFQALLAGVEEIKLAYVSRISPKDNARHSILGVQEFEPYELAQQMNLNIPNGFGILRALVDLCSKLNDNGNYVLMRDPQKPLLRLYKLPGGKTDLAEDAIDELVPATAELHISDATGSDLSEMESD